MTAFITVDFEDFSHDYSRGLGLRIQRPRTDALANAYHEINNLLASKSNLGAPLATFFVTGVLAKYEPDLIRQIARDGHEIACHYYYHDDMHSQSIGEVERFLRLAKDQLEEASNTSVLGFRAPRFKINTSTPAQYQIVEKYFEYDSSLNAASLAEVELFKRRMGLTKLQIFPVFKASCLGLPIKTGGSFARTLPLVFSKLAFAQNRRSDLDTILYVHPYEFTSGPQWALNLSDFENLPMHKGLAHWVRQNQWLRVGNYKFSERIAELLSDEDVAGVLRTKL